MTISRGDFQLTPEQRRFRAVWTGSDQVPLSILEAVRTLDTDDLAIITGWMRDPFFP